MERRKAMWALVLGVLAGLIATGIITIVSVIRAPRNYKIQIMSINEGKKVAIDSKSVQEKRNKDGILFIYATGSTQEYEGKVIIEVQPKDVPNWFRQDDAEAINGRYIAKIQLGSQEWPICGGEGYILRVSAGEDSARAMISVNKEKK
ncbi:MAG: hypothetical protein ACYSSI_12930 [Planctomycetota bacterium]|jgi:hypothetical protein